MMITYVIHFIANVREVSFMRNKLSNFICGLIFVAIGIGIAGDVMLLWNFQLFFPGWWTMLIIIPCLLIIIRNGFTVGATTGLIIGALLLTSHYVNLDLDFWRLILPTILIIIGLMIMFQGVFRKSKKINYTVHVEGQTNSSGNSARRDYNAIFASNNIKVTDHFTGASLNAIFGGIALDLRDAIINSDVEISATAVFGGIDIYVPSGVHVKVNNIPFLGGVNYKSQNRPDPTAYSIYLNSTTLLGGIDIK